MELERQKLKVHKSLQELFGQETTKLDLFLILLGSIALTVTTQIIDSGNDLSFIKRVTLALITLDIGGGIIANFTEGTNNYYAENIKKRYLFIAIHILQPLILNWIFLNNSFSILTITFFTLISAFIVTSIKQNTTQKAVAATLTLIGLILAFSLCFSTTTLHLILHIYSIKLILAFSVNWTTLNK
ncbi:MAG: hypothetical protein SFY56_03760 [Bacteroidota bacterium]|nr:hypothetical protein [Bacteroidota bacterium]